MGVPGRNGSRKPGGPAGKINGLWLVFLPVAVVLLTIGVAYFSPGNWDHVLTQCWTGNNCTFFQLAPVFYLVLGVVILAYLAVNVPFRGLKDGQQNQLVLFHSDACSGGRVRRCTGAAQGGVPLPLGLPF